jgi:hypothetical protein
MKTIEKNECSKTRPESNPYEIWKNDRGWTWKVLKKYQKPTLEAKNPYSRWFCAVQSPYTRGDWELGDVYVREVKQQANKVI